MLPRSARGDAVLCLGQMTLHWRGLGKAGEAEETAHNATASLVAATREEHEGYAGDRSGDENSSGDEKEAQDVRASMRSIK